MHAAITKHIIKRLFKDLKIQRHQVEKGFHKDAIHAFRVGVKKLNAFLMLLSSGQENAKAFRLPGKIKKIYSALGKVRDLQLQVMEIKIASPKTNLPAEYLSFLKQEIKYRKKACSAILEQHQLLAGRKKIDRKLPLQLPYKNTRMFLYQKIGQVLVLINTGLFEDNDLHSTRKRLKDIIYINEIYTEEFKRSHEPAPLNKQAHKKAVGLADKLGDFIDKKISLSLLKPRLGKTGPAEKKQLQSLCRRWQMEKDATRKNIIITLSQQ